MSVDIETSKPTNSPVLASRGLELICSAKITEKNGSTSKAVAFLDILAMDGVLNKMVQSGMTEASIQGGLIRIHISPAEDGASKPEPKPESPKEDFRLTDEERGILWHAIGMTTRNYRRTSDWWSSNLNHRNNYCLSYNSGIKEANAIRRLIILGLMKEGTKINDGSDQYFHVTHAGIKLAREEFFRARQNAKA